MLLRKTYKARSPSSVVPIRWQFCTTCCVGIIYFSLGLTYVTSGKSSLDQTANNSNRIFTYSRRDKLLRVSLYMPRKSQQKPTVAFKHTTDKATHSSSVLDSVRNY